MPSGRIKTILGVGAAVAVTLGPVSSWLGSTSGQTVTAYPQSSGPGQNIAVSSVNRSGGTTAGQITGAPQAATKSNEALAAALDKLASEIEYHPVVIGQQINVSAGSGASGSVIGQRIEVTAGPDSRGTVIGQQVSVSSGQRDSADVHVASDLRQIAQDVQTGTASGPSVRAILDMAGTLANAGITAASRGAVDALLAQYGP
jgi:hypothetical protein